MSVHVRVNPLDENVAPGERETIRAWAKQIFCNMILAKPGKEWRPKSVDLCGFPW